MPGSERMVAQQPADEHFKAKFGGAVYHLEARLFFIDAKRLGRKQIRIQKEEQEGQDRSKQRGASHRLTSMYRFRGEVSGLYAEFFPKEAWETPSCCTGSTKPRRSS